METWHLHLFCMLNTESRKLIGLAPVATAVSAMAVNNGEAGIESFQPANVWTVLKN
jgi:hypothetical protein